jgi:hypothetical protein
MTIEQEVLERCMSELHAEHPAEAALTTALMGVFDFKKGTIRNKAAQRQMLYAMGKKLATKGADGVDGWDRWLQQFVKDGALSAEQAAAFTAQAQAIHS